jgi:hypothetical protein
MPWSTKDAPRFTKKAKSGKSKRQWRDVADSALGRGASEGSAIRQANAVVAGTAMHAAAKRMRRAK